MDVVLANPCHANLINSLMQLFAITTASLDTKESDPSAGALVLKDSRTVELSVLALITKMAAPLRS